MRSTRTMVAILSYCLTPHIQKRLNEIGKRGKLATLLFYLRDFLYPLIKFRQIASFADERR